MKKKLFAAVALAFALVVGTLPTTAFAYTQTVAITITKPTVGATPDTNPDIVASYDVGVQLAGIQWGVASEYTGDVTTTGWDTIDPLATSFEAGNYYAVCMSIEATGGCVFLEDVAVTVNGLTPAHLVLASSSDLSTNYELMNVYYVFDLTDGSTHTHTYNPDVWGSNASQHWHECTDANCPNKAGSIKDVADHTFTWVVDREATTTEEGLKHEVCTVCGFTRSENTAIAKVVPVEGTPKTGDTTNIAVPIAILLIGGAVVGGAVFLRKKRADK